MDGGRVDSRDGGDTDSERGLGPYPAFALGCALEPHGSGSEDHGAKTGAT